MTLIHRIVSKAKIQDLDAFPKVPSDYKTQTVSGGTFSILGYLIIMVLVISEISLYTSSKVSFYYKVDTDMDSKLSLNVDFTVATPCDVIGADIIDSTNQNNAFMYGQLIEEPTYFDLTEEQRMHWDTIRSLNSYLRDEHHAIRDILWRKDTRNQEIFGRNIPPRDILRHDEPDACRFHGILTVNKVAGNLHVTIGKHVPLPMGHAHISLIMGRPNFNFSHRIEKFSFGSYIPSIINPLEGEEKITPQINTLYQYYLKVLSTDVDTSDLKTKTYQYSVTEKDRMIDHDSGSHGTPGIQFKYDLDAISIRVVEEHISLSLLLIRLCGIIGGVFATSGFLSSITSIIIDLVTCKYLEKVRSDSSGPNSLHHTFVSHGFHKIEGL